MVKRIGSLVIVFLTVLSLFPWSGIVPVIAAATISYNDVDPTGLYRTHVTFPIASSRARLDEMGVVVLDEDALGATVLVTDGQLETLARLRFQPRGTDEFAQLVIGNALQKTWLLSLVGAVMGEAQGLQKQTTEGTISATDLESQLQSLIASISPEHAASITALSGIDDDGDGLSNTQEVYWCTDPNNPNTDGDPLNISDGVEVSAVLDFTLPRNVRWSYGPPFGPPAAWPAWNQPGGCNDGDFDTIPDQAEAFELGSNYFEESTDHDKFDDGQELFGVTYCPGSPTSCGHGNYPRIEYWNFIQATMPNWVEPPGDNIFVAAFPIPEVSVVPGSWTVNRVTTITTSEGVMAQTTNSYETSVTRGQETSIADTVNWNNWEELSQAVETPLETRNISLPETTAVWPIVWGAVKLIGAGVKWCITNAICVGVASNAVYDVIKSQFSGEDNKDEVQPPQTYPPQNINVSSSATANASIVLNQNFDFQGVVDSLDGVQYAINQQGELLARGLYDISYQLSRPKYTETRTTGQSWGGAQTVTNSVYEEHTITEGQAFTTGQNWSTAWAVDSSHAADLTFTYQIQNNGTEYAREITGLVFSIYLGDDINPIISYPAWQQFPGGVLSNVFPGASSQFTSTSVALTLDQMRRIDLGDRITIVVEDYSYGADELFYQNAVNGGITVFIEDGVEDNDESVDTYVIPTWGTETMQDVLTRFFPAAVDIDGNLNSLWTPEFNGINPPTWNEHFLSDIAWWNVYLTDPNAGNTPLHLQSAVQGDGILFRFNRDSDRDGYQDRVELRYGTDKDDPSSHPQPEILAGYTATREGDVVTVLLKVANLGTFDAHGIDAVMYAPDATTTIGNNTVGGNGRLRPGAQIAVGSLILPPDLASWTGTADPYAAGSYSADVDKTFTFTTATPGTVGSGGAALNWTDGLGGSGTLSLGSSYQAPLPLPVADGLEVGFDTGTLLAGQSFTVDALTPRDTFTYTVNTDPYTAPVIVVSYSDPQGSHRFITPVEIASLSDDLSIYSGQMIPDPLVEILPLDEVNPTGTNTTNFVINSPAAEPIEDAHLYLNFISDGVLVSEMTSTMTLQPGPTIIPVNWTTSQFTQTYDASADNLLIAFWTDAQDNIIDSAARPLNSFATDPTADLAISGTSWNFGSVTKGTLLQRQVSLSSLGLTMGRAYASGTNADFATPYFSVFPGTFQTLNLVLDTGLLPTGAYNEVITLRTNDLDSPTINFTISGTVTALATSALAQEVDPSQPWNQYVYVPGPHNQNDVVTFNHTITDNPSQMHPLYVYSENGGTLLGVGEFGPDFTGQANASAMFGNGADGNLVVGSGQTTLIDYPREVMISSAPAGQTQITVANSYPFGITLGNEILIIQIQGTGAGNYEFARVIGTNVGQNTIALQAPLQHAYTTGGNNNAQVVYVPNYKDVTVLSGGTLTANAWGGTGGIVVFRASGTVTVNSGGKIESGGGGGGYNGGDRGEFGDPIKGHGWQGESTTSVETQSTAANVGGGGGGQGDDGSRNVGAGGGGGGYGTSGGIGQTAGSPPSTGGTGGATYGSSDLEAALFMGSGGGGGGSDDGNTAPGGYGARGGGIIYIAAQNLNVIPGAGSDGINANGTTGGNGASGSRTGGGGGGAGGSIFLIGRVISIGNNWVRSLGGAGGLKGLTGGDGGAGGLGRIHIQYCDSLTGTTTPAANIQSIECYSIRQLPGNPNTELTLLESITSYSRYLIPYGQRGTFTLAETPSGTLDYTITLPKRLYTNATLDTLFENLGSSTFAFSLDVGANGSIEWNSNGTQQPAIFTSPDLSASLNAYMTAAAGAWGSDVAVPIRVTLNTTGDVFLTNFVAAPGGDGDPKVGTGDLTLSDTTPTETQLVTMSATVRNLGNYKAENIVAAFFAGDPNNGGVYLGSDFVPSVAAGGSASASAVWDTTGYSGAVDVYVVLDIAGQLAELSETNNST